MQTFLGLRLPGKEGDAVRAEDFTSWSRIWGPGTTAATVGRVRFRQEPMRDGRGGLAAGAFIVEDMATDAGPEVIAAATGADVSLAGAGEAYESWRSAPAYGAWRQEIETLLANAAR